MICQGCVSLSLELFIHWLNTRIVCLDDVKFLPFFRVVLLLLNVFFFSFSNIGFSVGFSPCFAFIKVENIMFSGNIQVLAWKSNFFYPFNKENNTVVDIYLLFPVMWSSSLLYLIFFWLWARCQAGRQHKQMHLLSICKWQQRDQCGEQVGHCVPTMLFSWDRHSPLLLEGILSLSSVSISQMGVLWNVNLLQERNTGGEGFTSFCTLVNLTPAA